MTTVAAYSMAAPPLSPPLTLTRATISLHTDDDRRLTVPAGWAVGHLDHGYAMTCHKAQGATVDVALLFGGGGLTREAGYVGLSRGRVANHLYVADSDGADVSCRAADGLDLVARRLAARRAQTLATRQLPRRRGGSWRPMTTAEPTQHRMEGISR